MAEPITRREWLMREALAQGDVMWPMVAEAISSLAQSHPPGWADVLVHPDTGEPIVPGVEL